MTIIVSTFDEWRVAARAALQAGTHPADMIWVTQGAAQAGLFDQAETNTKQSAAHAIELPIVKKDFLHIAEKVACHSNPARWDLLYTALWRLNHGEKHLLALRTDDIVHALNTMAHQVSRDAHKMKAFVRFRQCAAPDTPHYLAWHQPDHNVLPLTAGFFQRRFAVMRWTIMTPFISADWDCAELHWGSGVPSAPEVPEDDWERIWMAYYRSTFNPARIKIKMMKSEMPVRYWHTMPETALIGEMLRDAPDRVNRMISNQDQ